MPDPNNTLLDPLKVILMPVCKAANTSLVRSIGNRMGFVGGGATNRIDHRFPNPTAREVFENYLGQDYLRVTFVRHPGARLVSCWADKVVKRYIPSFASFGVTERMAWSDFFDAVMATEDHQCTGSAQHWRGMTYDLTYKGKVLPNVIGRVESMETEWDRVRECLRKHTQLDLMGAQAHLNPSSHDKWNDYYTPAQYGKLKDRFAEDFQFFGYQ